MKKSGPNWLLRGFAGVSLVLHVIVFMHVAGIYRTDALSYIELNLQDVSNFKVRDIPRPRLRPKTPTVAAFEKPMVRLQPMPNFKPLQVDPSDASAPDTLVEGLAVPDMTEIPTAGVIAWTGASQSTRNAGAYANAESYLEMVRLKIEQHKRYPRQASAMALEGRVTLQFIITPNGTVREIKIAKGARYEALNTAARQAVENAAPFPLPPRQFFEGDIPLELTIVFELT